MSWGRRGRVDLHLKDGLVVLVAVQLLQVYL